VKGIAFAGAVALGLLAPAVAHADVETFVVDTTSASALTACTGAPADCSLPGAFANADDSDSSDLDTINFDSAIFDGIETVPGDATVVLTAPLITDEPLVVSATCADPGPCVGIDGPPAPANAIQVMGGTFEMRRAAIFGVPFGAGVAYLGFTTDLTLANNWFGLKLDGTSGAPTDIGVTLTGGSAEVGEIGAPPNIFAGTTAGIQVFTADDATIQNNAFGVGPTGAIMPNTTADIEIEGNGGGGDPENLTIGAAPNGTDLCDAGCNLIGAGGGAGITMEGSGPGTSTATNVDILGNHIGVNALGTASIGTAGPLIDVGEADDVTISGNRLGGGMYGVRNAGSSDNLLVEENSFGLNAAGNSVLAGPLNQATLLTSDPSNPVTVARNEIANPGLANSSLITIEGSGATVDENTLGLPGIPGSGGQDAIQILEGNSDLVEENSVSEATGSGIVLDSTSNSEVAGNEIGVDGPIGGSGIYVTNDPFLAQFNLIGGSDEARANVIEGVAGDAIRIEGAGSDFNRVEVNLGKDAGGLFLDLEPQDGPGNDPAGPNEGIQKPKVKSVEKEKVKGEGEPGGKVWLFLSRSAKGDVPTGLKSFIAKKGVKNDGTWKIKPDHNLGKNDVVTALQTDSALNSSELTKGKQRKK
jgi:parallel beta-helix repeat protein